MLIYGSCALKHWYPEVRTPNDLDIISREHDWIPAFEYLEKHNKHDQYVDPNFLLTIKVSHAPFIERWFDKTLHDIVFLKAKGCVVDEEFRKLLYQDWSKVHREKKVKLNCTNDEFFRENITRKYDHDYLHEVLAFYDRPLHDRIRKDLNSPMCSKELFDQLSFEDQLKCAMEECMVLGTEREILNGMKSFNMAKYKTLKRMILSATSGWFNTFIIMNFDRLINWETDTWQKKVQNLM